MQRLRNNDRGATAAIVALLMVPLVAVAAIAIDVAAMYADEQQLQTGADAGAIAAAQDCARGECELAPATAQAMAVANINDGDATGTVVALDEAAGTVTVETTTVREHWFAPVLGIDQTPIAARASARWGYPTGGQAMLPLIFSRCELTTQLGGDLEAGTVDSSPRTILFPKHSGSDCYGQSGNPIPGGFGWLRPSGECGQTVTVIDGWASSDTGNTPPSDCVPEDFGKWVGQTVFLPVFDDMSGTGANGAYRVYGYAAFELTSYYFAGQYRFPYTDAPCDGSDRCIGGRFTRFVDLSDDFDFSPDAPNLGAAVVALTE
ncbi:pilus assembly protein TadG-related protein [Georgenia sp. H159]|uniref:pilus assembly protein TadG-related protein n=1 Tax=Georgenia sp. H159 TaxID=3076115 RepID=UPI002D76CEF3|nr:pilus assembly protein TadG-related protein [Georgenia sp. H159]